MKKIFIILILLLSSILRRDKGSAVLAQTIKGFSVAKKEEKKSEGKTYALICGISNYKNPAIPSLQFADKDASAFRNYLVASGVDSNNITLLTNEQAKYAEILLELDDICTNKAKAGDKVYFYFSGHGDVESHVITNDGYLLPYDAPKVVYAISAIPVRVLQSYVSTLSSKGVQAIVITDACHSGNLAGGIEGMANIQNVLKDTWKDEIKILSCQPGELSLEGKQWGEGRGLFSYELTRGLAGMADKNKDGKVSMLELNLYLMEKVPEESSPVPQTPMLSGNMQQTISTVNKGYLENLNSGSSPTFAMIDTKGFDESLLRKLDDSIKLNFYLYKNYMDSDIIVRYNFNYFENNKSDSSKLLPSAYYYFSRIPQNESTSILVGLMKRNLCADIIEKGTTTLDTIISSTRLTGIDGLYNRMYEMKIARSIMGDEKLRTLGFLSKAIYFETFPYWTFIDLKDSAEYEKLLLKIDTAIAIDPHAAYLYTAKSEILKIAKKYDESIEVIKEEIKISPKFIFGTVGLAETYFEFQKFDSSIYYFKQLVGLDSTYYLESCTMNGMAYHKLGLKDSSESYFQQVINFSSRDFQPTKDTLLNHLVHIKQVCDIGEFYLTENKYDDALKYYFLASADDIFYNYGPNKSAVNFGISRAYSKLNDVTNAIKYLKIVLAKKEIGFEKITAEEDLNNIRSTPAYTSLMKKYFPEQYK